MPAERSGRRAGRIEQDCIELGVRCPFQRVDYDCFRIELGSRQIVGKSGQTTFRTIQRRHLMSCGGKLHRLSSRRSTGVEHVWVNGVATRTAGEDVEAATPGRLIRA